MTLALDPSQPIKAYVSNIYADVEDPTCRPRYLAVTIYPDAAQLRTAGAAYDRHRVPGFRSPESDAVGLWQPANRRSRYDRRRRAWVDTTSPFLGVMRLAQGHLTREVVLHECTHAAVEATRRHHWAQDDQDPTADLGTECGPDEEAFCYLLTGIYESVDKIVAEAVARLPRRSDG